MQEQPLTLTEKEMAIKLGMTYAALACARNRNPRNVPPHIRIGDRVCYRLDRLSQWLDDKEREAVRYTCI